MDNKKFAYGMYGLIAVLILAAVIVCICLAGKNAQKPDGPGTSPATEASTPAATHAATDPVTPGEDVTTRASESTKTPETTGTPVTTAEETAAPVTSAAVTTDTPVTTAEETSTPGTTNGSAVTNKPETTKKPETTQKPADTTAPDGSFSIRMSFAGDTQLADNYNATNGFWSRAWNANDPSYFLRNVKSVFEADDYTLLNLECVISDRDLERTPKTGEAYWYKGKTEYLQAITGASVEAVSLANNHVNDYGPEGYSDTVTAVASAGFAMGSEYDTLYYTKNGYTVAIICDQMWVKSQVNGIINRLKAAEKKSDFQIVFWHGGQEYLYAPEDWRVEASRALVDAGADLVIGNHAHVLQPAETYNGARIVYGLGNFCYGGMCMYENTTIIYRFEITVGPGGVTLGTKDEIIPCYYWVNYCQPVLITDPAAKQQVLDFMNGLIDKPKYVK